MNRSGFRYRRGVWLRCSRCRQFGRAAIVGSHVMPLHPTPKTCIRAMRAQVRREVAHIKMHERLLEKTRDRLLKLEERYECVD